MMILSPTAKSVIVSPERPEAVSRKLSSPAPPVSESAPAPPVRTLLALFPTIVSLPLPPEAFSITVPKAIATLPIPPPMLEKTSELRLMIWLEENPE